MPHINVYRDIDTQASTYVETITLTERDARVASMTSDDVPGGTDSFAYRDADGIVWGFALAATDNEIRAMVPPLRELSAEQKAAEEAELKAIFGGAA